MTELELEPNVALETPSPGEFEEAQQLREEIDALASDISSEEQILNSKWVSLGIKVHTVRAKKFWLGYGHQNFGEFIDQVGKKVKKGRSQIYQYVTVAEKLLPQIPAETLTEMGITNANELKKLAVATGKLIPQSLIDSALDPQKDTDQLKAEIAAEMNVAPEEKGKWFDLGGFYVTDDEKLLIQTAIKSAFQIDPPIAHDIPNHVQIKEVVVRWIQEFLAAYPEEA